MKLPRPVKVSALATVTATVGSVKETSVAPVTALVVAAARIAEEVSLTLKVTPGARVATSNRVVAL
jgi:hypothetical protein